MLEPGSIYHVYNRAIGRAYRRIMVQDNRQLINSVVYIHRNPVEAFLCEDPAEWKYSSFADIVSGKSDTSGTEVLSWFGDQVNFRFCHCGEQ